MHEFDVFVIGTGTAGETAAAMLREAGLSVGIADAREFGGTCALRGCQPKKYLVVPSHAALEAQGLTERGFVSAPQIDWSVIQQSRKGFTDAVPQGTEKGLKSQGITVFHERCSFVDGSTVQCGTETITARRFLIANGARPRPLPIPGGEHALTSDDFLALPEMPKHITFIGGGYISMEFATVAAAAGAHVTVLQRGDRVMDRFDPDLVEELQKGCAAHSIRVVTQAETKSITRHAGDRYAIQLAAGARQPDGTTTETDTTIETDLVFAALGRISNADTLNLEVTDVTVGRGGIETDTSMQTSAPNIYAVGDCVASIQLSPVSDAEARTAARNIIADLQGEETAPRTELDLNPLPTVVFTYPQLAQFGISDTEARERGGVRINTGSGAGWPNYQRLNESHVAYKVMIDESTDQILGAHILAPQAGELINLLALAARQGTPASEFREIPWAYPTYASDLKYMLG
ncbi:MAG: NAD(P)/FAD-dependent oxidoreductase [Alkalispirochaeta sp.]